MNIREISKGIEIDIDETTIRVDTYREENDRLQLYYNGDLVALLDDERLTLPQRGFERPLYSHGVTIEHDDTTTPDAIRERL